MKDNKGFTLIELLAVIIILGVIMLIAIPSVTTQITNSRKLTYAQTAKGIISGAKTIVNSGDLPVYKPGTTYYIPIDLVNTENGKRSPFGEFVDAYVVVASKKDGFEYYWTSNDTSRTGILLTHYDNLDKDVIVNNLEKISTDVAICGNNNIIIFDVDGTIKEEKEASNCINSKETYDGSGSALTSTDFFEFDSSTGTITSVHDKVNFTLLDANRCASYLHDIGFEDDLDSIKDFCINEFKNVIHGEDEVIEDMKNLGIIDFSIEHYPKNLVIPDEINGVAITGIGEYAFMNSGIESIKLPNSLKTIGSNAFYGVGLKSITIPNGVTTIENGAFSKTLLSKVTIPSTVTSLGNGVFHNCPILYEIINKTERPFNWASVIGYGGGSQTFVTGTYEYSTSDESFRNGRYFYDPYHVTIQVTSEDNVNINIDSMFDIGPYKFELVNTNGYKVYSYSRSADSYLETSPGPMNLVSGYCGALLTNYYITDDAGNILYQGFYKYYIENAAC